MYVHDHGDVFLLRDDVRILGLDAFPPPANGVLNLGVRAQLAALFQSGFRVHRAVSLPLVADVVEVLLGSDVHDHRARRHCLSHLAEVLSKQPLVVFEASLEREREFRAEPRISPQLL